MKKSNNIEALQGQLTELWKKGSNANYGIQPMKFLALKSS